MKQAAVFCEDGDINVTSPFGYRADPITSENVGHAGVDITRWCGYSTTATICAYADGVVTQLRDGVEGFDAERSEGNFVVIDHGGGYVSKYFHLACGTIGVSLYDRVAVGQAIGYMGSTGYSTGAHLHFQLEYNGVPTDPLPYLLKKLSIMEPPPSSWSREAVLWAIDSGLICGDESGRLKLGEPCTREMMCVFLRRLCDHIKNEGENK